MDIKHVLSCNPLQPAYTTVKVNTPCSTHPTAWIEHDGGLVEIGHADDEFGFDNEFPRHATHLEPFALADRPVTCGEWLAFMDDGGYNRPDLWLSDGWATAQAEGWDAPLYWFKVVDDWWLFTLGGPQLVDLAEPVCHVSYYEADAFARWAGARMPTEAEWEAVAADQVPQGNFLDLSILHPRPAAPSTSLFGNVWQWTSSSYSPYPGFRPAPGAVGEYNGKFMVNQYVLRGGSCITSADHIRATYRNFFPPSARWPFTGLRLAHDG
jgi:ergothioneine biosynthesis protein EgtB